MIPEICRGLASEAFYIWRQVAIVKSDLQRLHRESLDVFNVLDATGNVLDATGNVIGLIKKFNEKIRPFIGHCNRVFGDLSMPSKVSCGMLSESTRLSYLLTNLPSLPPCTLGYGNPCPLRNPGSLYKCDEKRFHRGVWTYHARISKRSSFLSCSND